jgi:hypothetical protein
MSNNLERVQPDRWLWKLCRNDVLLSSGWKSNDSSASKMEEIRSSETLITIYQTTLGHTPEDSNFHQSIYGYLMYYLLTN